MADQFSSKQSGQPSLTALLASLSPEQRQQVLETASRTELAAIESDWRQTIRTSLLAWCTEALAPAGHKPARHHRLLVDHLERLARGDITRLLVMMPPGAGKSLYCSQLFPAWFLANYPRASILGCSNTQDLADKFGRKLRDLVAEHGTTLGYELNADSRAAGRFETTMGGEFYAVGCSATAVGRRGDCILVDDPHQSREDVEREGSRQKLWDWFQSDLLSRLKPGGRIVLAQTRWHTDDLAGRLLQTQPDAWTVLKLPAIAEEDDQLGRGVGEWLWDDDPSYRYGEWLRERHRDCEANAAGREWDSLFMQTPVNRAGNPFLVDNLRIVDQCDDLTATRPVRAWDLAGTTKKSSDWSVGCRMHRLPSNRIVISDVVRLKGTPEMVEKAIVETAQRDGWETKIALAKDPGQSGLMQIEYLTRQLIGFEVISSPESGDKVLRASPFASQVNVGNVSVIRGDYVPALIAEMRDFPSGRWDDQIDSASRAFSVLGGTGLNVAMWEKLAGNDASPQPGTLEYQLMTIVNGVPPPVPTPHPQPPRPATAPHVSRPGLNIFGTS